MSYNPYYSNQQPQQPAQAQSGNFNQGGNFNAQMPPQQQQQQFTPMNGFNPNNDVSNANNMGGSAPFINNPQASMAFQIGSNAFNNFMGNNQFNQFQETMQRATGNNLGLSHYFQVSTSFVMWKFKQILLPFLKNTNNWVRLIHDGGNVGTNGSSGNVSFLAPCDDVNSPDMYMPLMGLITYILFWNIKQGLQGSFNPENLYYKLSSTLGFVGLDLLILKLGLYLLIPNNISNNNSVTSLVELTCYMGYKFIPLTLTLFIPMKPIWLNAVCKFYLFIAFGIFLLRSIKFNLFNTQDTMMINSIKKSTIKKCNYFLFVYGFMWQFVLMWLMA